MGKRLPQSFKNLSVQHPIKIGFTFPPYRGEMFSFVRIFAMVLTILRYGLNHSCSSIPILAPSRGSLKTALILFQSATNMCHEFANSEVMLEDCDPEGWDDVESDTSEGGSNDHDLDDFGDE